MKTYVHYIASLLIISLTMAHGAASASPNTILNNYLPKTAIGVTLIDVLEGKSTTSSSKTTTTPATSTSTAKTTTTTTTTAPATTTTSATPAASISTAKTTTTTTTEPVTTTTTEEESPITNVPFTNNITLSASYPPRTLKLPGYPHPYTALEMAAIVQEVAAGIIAGRGLAPAALRQNLQNYLTVVYFIDGELDGDISADIAHRQSRVQNFLDQINQFLAMSNNMPQYCLTMTATAGPSFLGAVTEEAKLIGEDQRWSSDVILREGTTLSVLVSTRANRNANWQYMPTPLNQDFTLANPDPSIMNFAIMYYKILDNFPTSLGD